MQFKTSIITTLLLSFITARPDGAPKCAIGEAAIAQGHGHPQEALGYSLETSSTTIVPGQSIDITVKNSAGRLNFKGILMYVQGQNSMKHLGKFENIDTSKFKPQTQVCKDLGFSGDDASTVTHANPSDKTLTDVKFKWTPLPGDEKDPGPFTLNAVMAVEPGSTGTPKWQILAPISLSSSAAAPSNPPTAASNGVTQAADTANNGGGRKYFKCKPRKKY